MRIGIVGSRGFIGKRVAAVLKKIKGVRLFFFDKPENDLLNSEPVALRRFVEGNDVIIHAAAVNRGRDDEIIAGSVVTTYNLISAAAKAKKPPKLIFLSSIQAETETVYGLSKKLAEIMLKSFSEKRQVPVSVFRLTNVFGEDCRPFYNSVVATFCYQAANNQKLSVHSASKNKKINLIYVGEVARIVAREVFVRRKNPFYFKRVSTKNEITVGELARLIESFKKNPVKLKLKFHRDLFKAFSSYLNGK